MTELQALLDQTSAALNRVEEKVKQASRRGHNQELKQLRRERQHLYVVLDTLTDLLD